MDSITVTQDREVAVYDTLLTIGGPEGDKVVTVDRSTFVAANGDLMIDTRKWSPGFNKSSIDVTVNKAGFTSTISNGATSWLHICGSENATFSLVADKNTSSSSRTATVTVVPVSSDEAYVVANTAVITVTQGPRIDGAIEPSPIVCPPEGGYVAVNIASDGRWNANCLSNWTVLKEQVLGMDPSELFKGIMLKFLQQNGEYIVNATTVGETTTYSYYKPSDLFDGTNPEVLEEVPEASVDADFKAQVAALYAAGTAIGGTTYKKCTLVRGYAYTVYEYDPDFDGTDAQSLVPATSVPQDMATNPETYYSEGTAIGSTDYRVVLEHNTVSYKLCYSGIGDKTIYIQVPANATGKPREARLMVRRNDGTDVFASVTQMPLDTQV